MAGGVKTATAQSSVAASSCSDYRNTTDPAKQAQYATYLQAYSNASSPDPRYVKSDAALAEDAKKISDWCGKNGKRTYGEAVTAIIGSAPGVPLRPPLQRLSRRLLRQNQPLAKWAPPKGCAGCSITCTGGAQAECREPADSPLTGSDGKPECIHSAWCYCKKPKKS